MKKSKKENNNNEHSPFNKHIATGKSPKINKHTTMFIPESRVDT